MRSLGPAPPLHATRRPALSYWQGLDKKTLKRIHALIDAARRDPFRGFGKPERLVGNLSGFWSRRIDETHRLVYAVDDADLTVIACRHHYQ